MSDFAKVDEVKNVDDSSLVDNEALKDAVIPKEIADDSNDFKENLENEISEGDRTDLPNPAPIVAIPTTPAVSTVENNVTEVIDQFKSLTTSEPFSQGHSKLLAEDSYLTSDITFSDPALNIPKYIRDAIVLEMKFDRPTRIQRYSLPIILRGDNLIAQAQTSAGKTVAFMIGMLNRIDPRQPVLQALCLTPTRELANQIVVDAAIPLSKYMPGIRIEAGLSGIPFESRSSAHLIVGTPGTILSWSSKRYINLSTVRIFVVDEADEMVSNDHIGKATLDIKARLNPQCQVLFFSATYTQTILQFSRRIVENATVITLAQMPSEEEQRNRMLMGRGGQGGRGRGGRGSGGGGGDGGERLVGAESLVLEVIKQVWINTGVVRGGKEQVLKDIYSFLSIQQSIVFVGTKRGADTVTAIMTESGYEVSTLHSDLEGYERDEVMARFRSGQSKVLITTNVLARGVDVPSVAVVVNYDLPTIKRGRDFVPDPATYVHRIGRTGRFNRAGTAITFVDNSNDLGMLKYVENLYSPGKPMIEEWNANDLERLGAEQSARLDSVAPL